MSRGTALGLLSRLRSRGVRISLVGSRLRVNAPRGAVTAELLEALRAQKSDLTDWLRTEKKVGPASGLSPDDLDKIAQLLVVFRASILTPEDVPEVFQRPWLLRCRPCHGARFWLSVHGATVCVKCHPPADEKLVAEWIEPSSGGS